MSTLKNKVILVFALVTILAFASSWLMLFGILKQSIINESENRLTIQVEAIGSYLEENGLDLLVENVRNWKRMINGRLSIVDSNGKVIADSDVDIASLDNHGNRPEIKDAFSKGSGLSIRYSRSLNEQLLYVTKAVRVGSDPLVIRISSPLKILHHALDQSKKTLLFYLALSIAVIILLEIWVIRHFFHPLENVIDVSCKIADGGQGHFPIMKNVELQKLSNSLDRMSSSLHGALNQLRGEREELNRIVTSMPIGVILLDQQKRVRYINDLAKELLAIKNDVKEGVSVERILPSGKLFSLVEHAVGKDISTYLQLPEKGNMYLKVSAIPTWGGMLLVINDLTEEMKLEESRRAFVADASHELQTPLTTVRVTAEYLMEEFQGNEKVSKYLSSIIGQQERMTSLVDDLLLLSKIESQPVHKAMKDVDLTRMMNVLVEELKKHPFAANIRINGDIEDNVHIMGRVEELDRAVNNVLENAVKYVREKFGKGIGGVVDVRLFRSGDSWKISVSDNGIGITEESAVRIFDRFQRGDSHRARGEWGKGGYGLGLSIAKRIIEGHGGSIELVRHTEGAEFEISLPADNDLAA